ncbi:MAG: hypothetical protein AAFR77_00470 [Cyanobacteria bacterium J06631_2]
MQNQEPNTQFPSDPVVLEMLLRYLELQNHSSVSNLAKGVEAIDIYPEQVSPSKPKFRPYLHPLSIYAIATTLLLVPLSLNYLQPSNANIANASNSDIVSLQNLETLASLQNKIEQLEAQIEVSAQILPERQVVAAPLPVQPASSPTAAAAIIPNPASESETQLLPVPFLPPPPAFIPTVVAPVTTPLAIQQPPKPIAATQQPILPTPKVVVATKSAPEEQWLGQTSAVYFSSTFEQEEQHILATSSILEDLNDIDDIDSVALHSQERIDLNTSLAEGKPEADADLVLESISPKSKVNTVNTKVEIINLDLLAKAEVIAPDNSDSILSDENLAKHLASAPLLDDLLVKERLGTSFATAQNVNSKSETGVTSNEAEVIDLDLLAKEGVSTDAESDLLPSDEELAKHLASAPLLDDLLVKERLGTSSTVAQGSKFRPKTGTTGKKAEVINLDLLARASNTSETKPKNLFSDEDLAKHLASTPLLSDRVLKQKLAASTITESDTNKASISNQKIPVINLSLLSEQSDNNTSSDSSDLTSYLIVQPSGK